MTSCDVNVHDVTGTDLVPADHHDIYTEIAAKVILDDERTVLSDEEAISRL